MTTYSPADSLTDVPCPSCGNRTLDLVSRFVPKSFASYSLAGVGTKFSGEMVPHLVCRTDGCGFVEAGKPA